MEAVYKTFVARVAAGRKKTRRADPADRAGPRVDRHEGARSSASSTRSAASMPRSPKRSKLAQGRRREPSSRSIRPRRRCATCSSGFGSGARAVRAGSASLAARVAAHGRSADRGRGRAAARARRIVPHHAHPDDRDPAGAAMKRLASPLLAACSSQRAPPRQPRRRRNLPRPRSPAASRRCPPSEGQRRDAARSRAPRSASRSDISSTCPPDYDAKPSDALPGLLLPARPRRQRDELDRAAATSTKPPTRSACRRSSSCPTATTASTPTRSTPIDYDACMKDGTGLFVPAMQPQARRRACASATTRRTSSRTSIARGRREVPHDRHARRPRDRRPVDGRLRRAAAVDAASRPVRRRGESLRRRRRCSTRDRFRTSRARSSCSTTSERLGRRRRRDRPLGARHLRQRPRDLAGATIRRRSSHKLEPGKLALYLDCGTEDGFGLTTARQYLHDLLDARKHRSRVLPRPRRSTTSRSGAPRLPKSLEFLRAHHTSRHSSASAASMPHESSSARDRGHRASASLDMLARALDVLGRVTDALAIDTARSGPSSRSRHSPRACSRAANRSTPRARSRCSANSIGSRAARVRRLVLVRAALRGQPRLGFGELAAHALLVLLHANDLLLELGARATSAV